MSYYLEARSIVKGMKDRVEVNKRNRERRAEQGGVEAQGEDPFFVLRVDGRACRLFRNNEAAAAVERMDGMLPWNGKADNLIDRFDGRALLDFYREPDGRRARPRTEDEVEEEELAAFEAYRDLVKIAGKKSETAGLAQAEADNLQIRANAKSATVQYRPAQFRQKDTASTPAGFGAFGAVGFSYGNEPALDPVAASGQLPPPWAASSNGAASSASSSDFDTDSEDDSDEVDDQQKRLAEEDYEDIAATFGIVGYQAMLRHALRDERREAEGRAPKPKWQFSRKKAAQRAKRMKGQGQLPSTDRMPMSGAAVTSGGQIQRAVPPTGVLSYAYRSQRRGSPSYAGGSGASRSRRTSSRSQSPGAKPRVQYITSFGTGGSASASRAGGSHQAPQQQSLRGSQPAAPLGSRVSDSGQAEDAPSPAVDDAEARAREAARAERYEARQKERAREKAEDTSRQPSGKAKVEQKAQGGKETQQERMQRLMKAQISKQVAKDTVTVRAKQAAEERDAAARRQIERAAMGLPRPRSPSPVRWPATARAMMARPLAQWPATSALLQDAAVDLDSWTSAGFGLGRGLIGENPSLLVLDKD